MRTTSYGQYPETAVSLERLVSKARRLSLIQTVVAVCKTVFAMALLSAGQTLAPLVVGLLAFAIYNTNNLADLDEDAVNCPEKTAFVRRWQSFIVGSAVVASVGAAAIALWKGGLLGLVVALVPFAAAVVYSLPVVPGGKRVKDVYLLNTVVVAAAWAVAVTYLPLALGGTAAPIAAVAVCLFFFLRTVVSVEVFNVRDVAGDSENGVATLPVVLGTDRAKRLLGVLDVGSLLVIAGAATVLPLSLALVAGLVPVVCYSLVVEWLLDRRGDVSTLCLAKDGEYLLMGLLVVALGV